MTSRLVGVATLLVLVVTVLLSVRMLPPEASLDSGPPRQRPPAPVVLS